MAKHQAANAAVQQVLDALVEEGTEIGVQVAAYLNGELVVDAWAGVADPATGRKVDGGTLFNVFSVTKAVAATALHVQAERGLVDYDSPVARYWPEYGSNGKEAVTVRDALSHRTGTPQMPPAVTPEMMCDWDAMTAGIAALEPIFPVGQPAYQAVSFGWVIGEIVRRTDPERRSFRDFVAQEIAGPFDIEDLWIGVPEAAEPRIARLVDALNMQPPPAGTVLERQCRSRSGSRPIFSSGKTFAGRLSPASAGSSRHAVSHGSGRSSQMAASLTGNGCYRGNAWR